MLGKEVGLETKLFHFLREARSVLSLPPGQADRAVFPPLPVSTAK